MLGGALALLAGPLAVAQSAIGATIVEGIVLKRTAAGLSLKLETTGDSPQVVTASSGKMLQADIAHARLELSEGESFTQKNPAPGIESVKLEAIAPNRVRVTVAGKAKAPISEIQKSADDSFTLALDTRSQAKADPSDLPESLITIPGKADAAKVNTEKADLTEVAPSTAAAPSAVELAQAAQSEETPEVLVPNPDVIIDGTPVTTPTLNGAPPFLPRAIAPPVGDLSVSDIDSTLDEIDLGTAERVPRLVLRDASAREVLSLLARAAGLNLAFASNEGEGEEAFDALVSLDIENEPVQNVFNYVLQLSGLDANKVGRTIFVAPRLPNSARNVLVRSIRLNQIDVSSAVNFLVSMGAESAVNSESSVTSVNAVEVGGGTDVTESTVTQSALTNQRIDFADADPLLRGLQIIGDERTNALTLIGTPRQIEIATAQMVQLDIRRRQVAVNLRVIDVNLNDSNSFGSQFSFGLGDTAVGQAGGVGLINFVGSGNPLGIAREFLAQLEASVQSSNAKIVTDPTLVIQEGQTAAVQLTQEVVTNITTDIETTEVGIIRTVTFEKEDAGLNLQVQIDRIDDNGFVTLAVAPSISAPTDSFNVGGDEAVLLANRQLTSGQIRIRDGQTLVLSGIIQESDRTTVTKVPILGDIPLLGALFRNSDRENIRRELIVLLTPQMMDDSDESVFGYSYTPGEDVQQLLENKP
ncbi:secretion system protein [cf. Phormidesmis sp. LEGE 11477]|nr:type IV pilus secretin family protein [cf. Phormidesmis sp. LEGE 11477]MBE9063070.1 secretion system protein [cf. Phormidesmis sp. LEGE 11477]